MALSDYAHHNEDARAIWWQEEGRFEGDARDPDDFYDRDYVDFDYCTCVDDDSTCTFEVSPDPWNPAVDYVWRTCDVCGCGEGSPVGDPKTDPEWLRRAGVTV